MIEGAESRRDYDYGLCTCTKLAFGFGGVRVFGCWECGQEFEKTSYSNTERYSWRLAKKNKNKNEMCEIHIPIAGGIGGVVGK